MKRAQSSSSSGSNPPKKQKFKAEYSNIFPCLVASKVSDQHVRCLICEIDFQCAAGGRFDCKRHVETNTHKQRAKPTSSSPMTKFFAATAKGYTVPKKDYSSLKLELVMLQVIIDHNMPFSAMDSIGVCMREGVDDSTAASGFHCGRTKATALVKEMGSMEIERLVTLMRKLPFSIAIDGSNDQAVGKKFYPIVVRVNTTSGVETGLLSLCATDEKSTGENIFRLIDNEFSAHSIPWTKCLAIGSDNAPNMIGLKSGVIAYAREKHGQIFKAGCIIHLVHIAARKGAEQLGGFEEIMRDLYFYFRKSVNRQADLKQFQEFHDVETKQILKHGATRWLSIQRCLHRLLHNWEPLKDYFFQEKTHQKNSLGRAKASVFLDYFKSPTNKLLCKFALFYIKQFDTILVDLQAGDPKIHVLLPKITSLVETLMGLLLDPEAIKGKHVSEIDIHNNVLEDMQLVIGTAAKEFIANGEANKLRQKRLPDFYSAVKSCYQTCIEYLVKNLPWQDELLRAIRLVDPAYQNEATDEEFLYLLRRFPALMEGDRDMDFYLPRFRNYKSTDTTPFTRDSLDATWAAIMKGKPVLEELGRLMLSLLTIPHSSAECERVFSVVRKNLTDTRSSMSEGTLESLLVLKANKADLCSRIQAIKNLEEAKLEQLKSTCRLHVQKS